MLHIMCSKFIIYFLIVYDSNSWKNTLMMCFYVVEFKKEISENLRVWSNSHGICRCDIISSVCLSVSTDHSSRQEIHNLSTLRTTREFSHAPKASWATEHTPVCSGTVRGGGGYNVVHSAQIPLPYSARSICAHTHTYICTYIYYTCVLYICICIMRLCLYSVFPYINRNTTLFNHGPFVIKSVTQSSKTLRRFYWPSHYHASRDVKTMSSQMRVFVAISFVLPSENSRGVQFFVCDNPSNHTHVHACITTRMHLHAYSPNYIILTRE